MERKPKVEESHGEGAPHWVLSFGDMITNLLAFVMLLQSFSKVQNADLLQSGNGGGGTSHGALASYGGDHWLLGDRLADNFEKIRIHYAVESDPDNLSVSRIIDAEDEKIRKMFDDLRHSSQTKTAKSDTGSAHFITTPIAFEPGSSALNADAKEFLRNLAVEMAQGLSGKTFDVYVIGMTPEEVPEKDQWVTSAKRARAVEEFLAGALAPELRGDVRTSSVGAGPDTGLSSTHNAALKGTFILISVREGKAQE
jgi:flagellar motor protein MotB